MGKRSCCEVKGMSQDSKANQTRWICLELKEMNRPQANDMIWWLLSI